jgi:hypothetical protein
VNLLRRVGRVPPLVTDGAFSPDGRLLVLRDYLAAHLYGASGGRLATVTLPLQPQGESVAFSADGRSLLAGSEGAGSEVVRVPLPAAAAPPASATTPPARQPPSAGPPAAAPAARARGGAPPFALLAAAGGALVAVAAGGLAARSRRRARQG